MSSGTGALKVSGVPKRGGRRGFKNPQWFMSKATDLQQSAEYTTTIMQWTINPCKTPQGRPTGHVFPNGETAGCISYV